MHDDSLTLRPKRSLIATGIFTFLALTIPLFGVLYWYSAGTGAWPWLLAIHAAIAVLSIASVLRQRQVFVTLDHDVLFGNGIFSPTLTVPRSEIHSVVLARVYARASSETSIQFTALDAQGTCLFRMRGQFWHEADLRRLAAALAVGPPGDTAPLSPGEFFATFPDSRYWFERAR